MGKKVMLRSVALLKSGISKPFFEHKDSAYFEISVSEFYSPLEPTDTTYAALCERLRGMDDNELSKVNTLIDLIETQ